MQFNKIRCLNEYEVNIYTMTILPILLENKLCSRIIEIDEELIVKMKPIEVVDRSCKYFGSSLKGRKEGTRELMGITHKPPIIIEPSNQIFLFPTASPSSTECAWLSHSHIIKHSPAGNGTTNITFRNKKIINFDISKGSFENQLFHTAQLRTIISSRMEKKERRMNFFVHPSELSEEMVSENMVDFNHYKYQSE